jgi:hypothetical protein
MSVGVSVECLNLPHTSNLTRTCHNLSRTCHNLTRTWRNLTRTCHNLTRTWHNLTQSCHNLTRTCQNLTRTCHNLTRTCHNLTRACHNLTRTCHNFSPRQPCNSAGSDGVTLCTCLSDVKAAYELMIGKTRQTHPSSRTCHNLTRTCVCRQDERLGVDQRHRPSTGKLLMIYICNFHVLNHFLLIFICNRHGPGAGVSYGDRVRSGHGQSRR